MAHHYCAVSHPNEAIGFLRCLLANEHVFLIIKKMWTCQRIYFFKLGTLEQKYFAVCTIFIQSVKWSHKDTVWPSYFFALYLFSELYVKELKKWNSDIFFSAEWSFDSTFTCANKIISFWRKKKIACVVLFWSFLFSVNFPGIGHDMKKMRQQLQNNLLYCQIVLPMSVRTI